jgi:hypothetical protein
MKLSDFDLQQLDEARLQSLPEKQKDALLVKLLEDLKEARERLKATSKTSSRPPSSDSPWLSGESNGDDNATSGSESASNPDEASGDEETGEGSDAKAAPEKKSSAEGAGRRGKIAGRRVGVSGQGGEIK